MKTHDRLRIAIQKSGRLGAPARELLARAGFVSARRRRPVLPRREPALRPAAGARRRHPRLVEEGSCDLGIVGLNLVEERAPARRRRPAAGIEALLPLGFGRCRLSIAVPKALHGRAR
jgi:ATP phosphoribosyltransferase